VKLARASLTLSLLGSPALAQSVAPVEDPTEFVVSVRAATSRYRDQSAAVADGYHRIGPDFPSMGEHWLSVPLVVRGQVDPLHPPILEYVTIAGRPVLAGVAYTQLVRDGLPSAPVPAPPGAWHFHQGSVDQESFILSHAGGIPRPARPGQPRVAVLHAWLWLENPSGLFETDNWSLPWYRLGIAPPEWAATFSPAALAAALASGGEPYFSSLLRLRQPLTPEQGRQITAMLSRHAVRLRGLLQAESGRDEAVLRTDLSRAWSIVEADLRAVCESCAILTPGHHE
jgi:hypothetical protein